MKRSVRAVGLAGALFCIAACGGPRAAGPHQASPGRPALAVVPIAGDGGAVTLAVATPGDARAALLLATLLGERLGARAAQAGLSATRVETGFGADGAWVTMPLAVGREAATVRLLRATYMDTVSAAEATALQPKERAYESWPGGDDAEGALARCRGVLHRVGAATRATATQRDAERARYEASSGGLSLGVTGSAASIARVRDALEEEAVWGERAPAPAAAPIDGTWKVHATEGHETRAHVLFWAPGRGARAQIAFGRMLAEPGALGVPVAALGGGVRLERADATLVPLVGSCLAVTLTWPERASEAAVAQATALVRQRLAALAPSAVAAAAESPALVAEGASGPTEIAERAAYLALAERGTAPAATTYVLDWPTTHGEPAPPQPAALAARLAAETRGPTPFPLEAVVHAGLPESWLLLASPCGTQGESEQDAGASAAYALAAAARASELAGATAEPWVEAGRVGLLLHAGARAGETPAARAERLATAAARAWLGDGLALEAALRRLERADAEGLLDSFAPGGSAVRVSLGFAEGDAHGALAFGAVAALRPFGTTRSRRALREAAVRLRGETLAHGPLAAGYLAAAGGEAARAQDVLASTLRTTAPCPAAPARSANQPASGRLVRVPHEADAAPAPLLLLLRVPDSVDAAALDAATAYLDDAVARRLTSRLRAHRAGVWGAGSTRVLVLRLGVPPAAQDAALAEVRALFTELAAGRSVDPDAWERARGAARAATQRVDYRLETAAAWARAARLSTRPRTEPPSAPPFAALLAPDNLVVVQSES